MRLTQAQLHQIYTIRQIVVTQENALSIRLRQLGFVEGEQVCCLARSRWGAGPLLLEIRGIQVALASNEAELIEVDK
jgi:Fe2+ transport system protein FeoA